MAAHQGKLIYVVGPSGAGKDALLDYARAHLPPSATVKFAQRWITRAADAGGEAHLAVTTAEFDAMLAAGRFALHWRAHGNGYGIGTEIDDWLREGNTVVVSGSRENARQARAIYPNLSVIEVTVDAAILRDRLTRRGRETAAEIDERIARAAQFALPQDVTVATVRNDGPLEEGGQAMLDAILTGR